MTTQATQQFSSSLMIFAVIGIGYRRKLLFVERAIDTEIGLRWT
jgi:hypothetical protein